jgi:tetratricopeptide (TPR) repeat protein
MRRIAPLLASVLTLTPALAQTPAGHAPATTPAAAAGPGLPQPVVDDFISGFQGDTKALDRAMAAADAALARDPANAPALAWRSAGLGARCGSAFDKGDFAEGMKLWNDSVNGLNKAVTLSPADPAIRFVRGKSMLESAVHDPNPESSAEAARTAIADLELAMGSFSDLQKQLPAQTRDEVYLWLYQASERTGDKGRVDKYKKLAGDRAKEASKQAVAAPADTSPLRAAMVILDTPLAREIGPALRAGGRDTARVDAVIVTLDKKLEAAPGDPGATAWRGFARTIRSAPLFEKGQYQEAMKLWNQATAELAKAASADATSRDALVLRGLTLLDEAGHIPQEKERDQTALRAASEFERLTRQLSEAGTPLAGEPAAEVSLALARAYQIRGDAPKARAAIDAAKRASPTAETAKRAAAILDRVK